MHGGITEVPHFFDDIHHGYRSGEICEENLVGSTKATLATIEHALALASGKYQSHLGHHFTGFASFKKGTPLHTKAKEFYKA